MVSLRALLHRRDDMHHLLRQQRNRLEAGRMTDVIKQLVLNQVQELQAEFKTTEGRDQSRTHRGNRMVNNAVSVAAK